MPATRSRRRLRRSRTGNVSRLQVAWTYRSGDARAEGRSQIQCNPIVVRGVLYGTSPQLKVFALDAATGVATLDVRSVCRRGAHTQRTRRESRCRVLGKRRGPAHPRGGRTAAVCAGREDGKARAVIRSERQREPEGRARRARAATVRAVEHTGRDLPGPPHHRHAPVGRPGAIGAGPHPRVRCPDGSPALGVQDHSGAGRVRLRHMAARRVDAHRRRQCVERHLRRHDARPGVPADRLGGLRLLGRQPPRPEPVCQLAARAQGGHGRTASGTTSSCTTISGIATCHRRPCW